MNVDFVDNWEDDVISTNRQAIDWEIEKTKELRTYLVKVIAAVEKDWRERRKEKRLKDVQEKTKIDIPAWYKTLPAPIQIKIQQLVNTVDESELSPNEQSNTIETLHDLVPEYPNFHWRHLHSSIQDAAKTDYENEDYYRAFLEAMKRYINEVRNKSGSLAGSDSGMMGEVFGRNKTLCVSGSYKRPDGSDFHVDTMDNIEDGQKFLSMGILAGGRNPVSHEEIKDLRDSKLFSEKDCLDALSLLSHLFGRLEKAMVK